MDSGAPAVVLAVVFLMVLFSATASFTEIQFSVKPENQGRDLRSKINNVSLMIVKKRLEG
jgi:hypothetical protein